MSAEDEPLAELVIRPEAEGLGSEFMRDLDASLSYIQRNPASYAIVHKQVRRALLRRFPHSVIYFVQNDQVIVLACFHASRDPKQWKKRT